MPNGLIEPEHHKHQPDKKKKDGVVPEPSRVLNPEENKPPPIPPGRQGGTLSDHVY